MRIGIKDSIFPVRDAWDKFLIHGVATPAMIGVAGTTAFLTGGTSLLVVTGALALVGATLNEFIDITKRATKGETPLPKNHPVSILTKRIAQEAGLENIPKCYSVGAAPDGVPFAGAAGTPKSGVVLVSENIHNRLSPKELEGVIAHEIAHIGRSDTKTRLRQNAFASMAKVSQQLNFFNLMFGLVGLATIPSLGSFAIAAGGIVSCQMIAAATSRACERRADRAAITITKNPWALSSALKKIVEIHKRSLLQRGMSPDKGITHSIINRLFSTHPEIAYRFKRLKAMAGKFLKQEPELHHLKNETLREIEEFDYRYHRQRPHRFTIDMIIKRLAHRVSNFIRKPVQPETLVSNINAEASPIQVLEKKPTRILSNGGLSAVEPSTPGFNLLARNTSASIARDHFQMNHGQPRLAYL